MLGGGGGRGKGGAGEGGGRGMYSVAVAHIHGGDKHVYISLRLMRFSNVAKFNSRLRGGFRETMIFMI